MTRRAAVVRDLLALLLVGALALQLAFVARIAWMAVSLPESTTFQRSEAWRLLLGPAPFAWQQQSVPYERISANLKRAVIASEDAGFCAHWGFDFTAIRKALRHNEKSGRLRGGSTISNQTAKNAFLWPGDTTLTRYARKAIEPYFTLLIETMWGKKRILEVYLNVVEWAPGVYGAEAAAQHHFGKPAADLSRREAALLAAALPNPLKYNAGKPGPFVARRAGQIQAQMNDVADPTGDPCVH